MILEGRAIDVSEIVNELGLEVGMVNDDEIITRCPWPENHSHGDRHPSFCINGLTGKWICFTGCGAGDLWNLIMRLRYMEEPEAKRWLLANSSSDTSFDTVLKAMPTRTISSDLVQDVHKIASADYMMADNKTMTSYILERGFTIKTLIDWGIRYDRSSKAVVIPLYSADGENIVGIARRMVPPVPTGFPKYRYTQGFDRKNHLFGAHKHIKNGDPTIVVEGPLDAMWLHQYGYKTAVALMGSFCSRYQIDLLKKLSHSVIISLDSDEAGRSAASKLASGLSGSFPIQVVELPDGKDVQELTGNEMKDIYSHDAYPWMVEND